MFTNPLKRGVPERRRARRRCRRTRATYKLMQMQRARSDDDNMGVEDEMLGAVRSRVKLWTIGAKSVAKGDHCRRLILRLILRMREPPLPHGHQAAVARVVVGACQERSRDSSHRHKRRPMLRAATMDAHEPHDHLLIARSLSLLQPSASFCFACCTCSKGNEHTP